MKILFLLSISIFAIGIFAIQPARAAVKIAEDLYLAENVTGVSGNAAFLVTEEGVIVVDSGASRINAEQIQAEVRSVTSQPIRYLILTHNHFDHTFGAAYFPATVTVIGHKNLETNLRFFMENGYYFFLNQLIPQQIAALENKAKQLEAGKGTEAVQQALLEANAQREAFKEAKVIYPQVLITNELSLRLGGQQVDIRFPGAGHTDDNLIVWFPKQKVLHAGDLVFHGAIPYIIPGKGGSDTANWIRIAESLAKEDINVVIPGHGMFGSKDILLQQARLLNELRAAVADSIKRGQSVETAQQNIRLAQYDAYAFQDILPMDIEAVYKELTQKD